ncbi:MAG: hypothetical protein Dasosvirus4_18 [Dasosvirus sp.]|uniref:Uncharacterized protein n=1 Tax=Dasosvirus sp. TaxID=2487764 RepID=A0A3G4ZRH6_9VIRU|nr:MAG: hypothetical protein Dasosvirus4_18 [Dasosvirus sp.]
MNQDRDFHSLCARLEIIQFNAQEKKSLDILRENRMFDILQGLTDNPKYNGFVEDLSTITHFCNGHNVDLFLEEKQDIIEDSLKNGDSYVEQLHAFDFSHMQPEMFICAKEILTIIFQRAQYIQYSQIQYHNYQRYVKTTITYVPNNDIQTIIVRIITENRNDNQIGSYPDYFLNNFNNSPERRIYDTKCNEIKDALLHRSNLSSILSKKRNEYMEIYEKMNKRNPPSYKIIIELIKNIRLDDKIKSYCEIAIKNHRTILNAELEESPFDNVYLLDYYPIGVTVNNQYDGNDRINIIYNFPQKTV